MTNADTIREIVGGAEHLHIHEIYATDAGHGCPICDLHAIIEDDRAVLREIAGTTCTADCCETARERLEA